MKRKLLLSLLFCTVNLMAQKIDPLLTLTMQQCQETVSYAKMRNAIGESGGVNGVDTAAIKNTLEVCFFPDGMVKSFVVLAKINGMPRTLPQGVRQMEHIGSTLILDVKADALKALADVPEIEHVEASRILNLHNERARLETASAYVTGELQGYGVPTFGEGQYYTGKGVVVGIVDQGIDFNHPAFRDPLTGKTRIKKAVYYNGGTKIVATDEADIENLTTGYTSGSHGTHTSATAAGSPVEGVNAQGIAHEAELVLIDCGSSLSDNRILTGVNEVFEYASSVGKPAVINMSLGSNLGFHDGKMEIPYEISKLTGEGRIVCVSAGNEAENGLSIVKRGSIKTLLLPTDVNSDGQYIYDKGLNLWINSSAEDGFTVIPKLVDLATGEVSDLVSGDLKLSTSGNPAYDLKPQTNDVFEGKGYLQYYYNKTFFVRMPGKALAIFVESKNEEQTIYLIDRYAHANENLVGEAEYPQLVGFDSGSGDMSINTLACTDDVLSVGSYVHAPYFTGIDGKQHWKSSNSVPGRVATYSSYGIDENGKSRPDVIAPGMWTVSGYNLYDTSYFDSEGNPKDLKMVTNSFDATIGDYHRQATYGAMTGTSMACPVMTGIVALWLQADPTLTAQRIREMLPNVCLNDKWTTIADNIPNHSLVQAGQGKVDALRGIKMIENTKAGSVVYPLDATITLANSITTFSSEIPLDFSSSSAPMVYAATSFDGETLGFTRGESRTAANVGLLITGEPGEYRVPIAAAGLAPETNLLHSTATAPQTLEEEGIAYVLSMLNNVIGFYQNGAGLIVPQGKAYLQLPQAFAGAHIRGFQLTEHQDAELPEVEDISLAEALQFSSLYIEDPLGIETVKTDSDEAFSNAYNISGQRVNKSYKGIVIVNGRKYSTIK